MLYTDSADVYIHMCTHIIVIIFSRISQAMAHQTLDPLHQTLESPQCTGKHY